MSKRLCRLSTEELYERMLARPKSKRQEYLPLSATARERIAKDRALQSWKNMKQRCILSSCPSYKNYGGRGISVCDRWLESFKSFLEDMGPRPYGLTLERIDNNGNYEPGNCRWADRSEQANNKRNNKFLAHDGKNLTYSQWAREIGIAREVIDRRAKQGLPIKQILRQEQAHAL